MWILAFLLLALLVCLSPLFERIWQLMPHRPSKQTTQAAAYLGLSLAVLATAWALFRALTFTLGSHASTPGSLTRWGITLFGLAGCAYVWRAIDQAKQSAQAPVRSAA